MKTPTLSSSVVLLVSKQALTMERGVNGLRLDQLESLKHEIAERPRPQKPKSFDDDLSAFSPTTTNIRVRKIASSQNLIEQRSLQPAIDCRNCSFAKATSGRILGDRSDRDGEGNMRGSHFFHPIVSEPHPHRRFHSQDQPRDDEVGAIKLLPLFPTSPGGVFDSVQPPPAGTFSPMEGIHLTKTHNLYPPQSSQEIHSATTYSPRFAKPDPHTYSYIPNYSNQDAALVHSAPPVVDYMGHTNLPQESTPRRIKRYRRISMHAPTHQQTTEQSTPHTEYLASTSYQSIHRNPNPSGELMPHYSEPEDQDSTGSNNMFTRIRCG